MHRLYLLLLAVFSFHFASAGTASILADSIQIDIQADTLLVCMGTSIDLRTTADADTIAWSPAADFDDPGAATVTLTPSQTQWYFMTATAGGVICEDSVFIRVIDPSFEVLVSTNDTLCPEDQFDITYDSSDPITSIEWSPDDDVVRPNDINGTPVRPLRPTEYIVTATIGNCTVSDTIRLEVVRFELINGTPDTIFICKPDTVVIRMSIIPGNESITWSPLDDFIIPDANGTRATVFPEISTVYTATATFEGCTLQRSTLIKVDSLPDLEPLTPLPFKDPYCAGDTFWIIGPRADTALYPDLEWSWTPMDGQIVGPDTPGTTGNVRVMILDTTTFIRTADNNACSDTSAITVNAIPPEIPLSLNDTTACPGEMFTVRVLDPNIMELEWDPPEGLSCTECVEPTVTVLSEPQQYTVSGMKEDCPVTGQLNVNPLPFFAIPVTPPQAFACDGDQIELLINDTGLSNLNITVQEGDGTISCTDCTNPTLTINGFGTILITADVPDSLGCGAQASIPYGIGQQQMDQELFPICPDEPTVFDFGQLGLINPIIDDVENIADCDGLNCTVTVGTGGGSLFINSDAEPPFCGRRTEVLFSTLPGDGGTILPQDTMQFGQGETATLLLEPPGPDGTTYMWFVNGVEQEATTNPAEITFPTDMMMAEVKVVWTNSSGCMEMTTEVYNLQPPDIRFPNAFTPNGDGTNERFRPDVVGPAILDVLLVFNRWGQKVYEGSDPDGWDGTFQGEDAPTEVYAYLAVFRFPNGDELEFKGDVTLIR